MTDRELTCQELVELVTDYLDDALDPADRARFDAHVASCPGCDAHLAQMRTTLVIVGATAELEARPEVAGLLEAFGGGRGAVKRPAPAARPTVVLAATTEGDCNADDLQRVFDPGRGAGGRGPAAGHRCAGRVRPRSDGHADPRPSRRARRALRRERRRRPRRRVRRLAWLRPRGDGRLRGRSAGPAPRRL